MQTLAVSTAPSQTFCYFLCANQKNVSAFEILALIFKKLPFPTCTREFLQLRSSLFTVRKSARNLRCCRFPIWRRGSHEVDSIWRRRRGSSRRSYGQRRTPGVFRGCSRQQRDIFCR